MFLQLNPISQDGYWIAMAVGTVAICVATIFLFFYLRIYRLIHGTPTSLLRSAAQGFVEIEGFCLGTAFPLTSPYSGRPCVWYRCQTYKKRKTKKSHRWERVDKQESPHWFKVGDPTGTAWVNPKGASMQTQLKQVWYGSSRFPTPSFSSSLTSSFSSGINGQYRYVEELLVADSPFYGLGRLGTLNPEQLRAIQVREWVKQSRRSGTDQLIIDDKGASNDLYFDGQATIHLLHKPKRWGYPFIVSGSSQARTASRIRTRLSFALAACVVFTWLIVELQYVSIF